MAHFVSADWVEAHLDDPNSLLLDPRGPMRYMQGHLRGAVNLPATRLFDREGKLLSVYELAEFFGSVGLGNDISLTLYDGGDGRNAALVAWTLDYLGYNEVRIMDLFFEEWAAQGRPKFYRPVRPTANQFLPQVNPQGRATFEEVAAAVAAAGGGGSSGGGDGGSSGGGIKLLDLRSAAEYAGLPDLDTRPGHIPGAVNLPWTELVDGSGRYLQPPAAMRERLAAQGINPPDKVIAYCRSGIRASVGWLALQQLGMDVRLYDGSYQEWMHRGMAVESSGD